MSKKIFCLIILVSIFILFAVPGIQFAAGWEATASSDEGEFPAGAAIDGDMQTRWSSKFNDGEWWQVDFGKPKEIKKVIIHWEAAYTREYSVLISNDGKKWEEVYATSSGKGGMETIDIEPVKTRFLKLDLKKRATDWGNSFFEIQFNEVSVKGEGMLATSSSGDADYSPDKALDGNFGTRWSSNFTDDEWWQVEFGEPKKLCGVVLHWETAFGEKYNIKVQGTDGKWTKVYETMEGNGQRDIIYFKPMKVKKLKLQGIQRGTGWGFSLWEVDLLGGNNPPELKATNTLDKSKPSMAMDGFHETAWQSGPVKTAVLTIELPKTWDLGGIMLTWGNDYASSYTVEFSNDGDIWKVVKTIDDGNGKIDELYFDPAKTKLIRINCQESSTGKGFSIKELELRGAEEKATPIKIYQAAAKDAREGFYPMWLRRVQEFWTVIGGVGDEVEALFGETGAIEPYKGGYTVLPYIFEGKKVITYADCKLDQDLVDDILPIPSVVWKKDDWKLRMTAVGESPGKPNKTVIRYRFTNNGKEEFNGQLALAVFPVNLNPAWQHGGLAPINDIAFKKGTGQGIVDIHGGEAIKTVPAPISAGATDIKGGDVVKYIKKAEVPGSNSAHDGEGLASGAMLFDLKVPPGDSKDIVVFYLHYGGIAVPGEAVTDPGKYFDKVLGNSKKFWTDLLERFEITIPKSDMKMINMMKTNIAYILINKDGPWTKPGSRNYCHSWVRDGAMTSVTLLRVGLLKEVEEWINAVSKHIPDTGMVPYIFFEGGNPVGFNYFDHSGEGKEFDSQGQFTFAVRQYYDYTNDKSFLNKHYDKAINAVRFIHELRKQRLTAEYKNDYEKQPYYGILPLSNSHEGYYPAKHSYWDDFWALRGFKDAIHLAKIKGNKPDQKWLEETLLDFRKDVINSIKMVIERNKLNNIPGCVEKADCDPTSTAIAIMMAAETQYLPQKELKAMFDSYYKEFVDAIPPGKERTFTPYEVRNADAFVRMGYRERALTMMRYFLNDSVRPYGWNHMAEVVHARDRAPSYIGDMPHTWVGSGYINAVRSIFLYEEGDKLVLAAGVDPRWFKTGITVSGLPTIYGKVNYTIKEKDKIVTMDIKGNLKPPGGFEVPLPEKFKNAKVTINGKKAEVKDGTVIFSRLPAVIKVTP
ncbi:MAG: discoidin domain-containing protein [Elusimicrobia bacterium]|nr:discoidin domain-containing protein [Elusimicrobiota bacterium]